MRVDQIRSFVCVYETGNFTAAARRLYTEQPVITKHILQLENELGCSLFARTTRKVAPTRAGDVFYSKAKEALLLLDRGIADVKMLDAKSKTSLNIGYFYLYMDSLTTAWTREFVDARENVSVSISESSRDKLIDEITEGTIDCAYLGLTSEDLIPAYLGRMLVVTMGEVIVVSKDHRLANKEFVTVDDLLNEDFVYPIQKPTSINSAVMRDFEDRGKTLHSTVMQFESSAMKLVEIGEGIVDLPAKSPIDTTKVTCVPYKSDREIMYYCVWNLGNKSEIFRQYLDHITKKSLELSTFYATAEV